MKNLMSLFVFATLLLLTSCSKEPMLQTENASVNQIEKIEKISLQSKNQVNTNIASAEGTTVPVSKISSSVSGQELFVDYSSLHNFSDEELEATQTIDFTDGNGESYTYTFEVINYTGGNGSLGVTYRIGGNNIGGLTIVTTQQIVIDDFIIE